MRIVKKILLGSLELEPEAGKIWLCDLTGCVLRATKLDFKQIAEKFDIVEIFKSDAYMQRGSLDQTHGDEVGEIEKIVDLLLLKAYQNGEVKNRLEFFQNVFNTISELVENEKKNKK